MRENLRGRGHLRRHDMKYCFKQIFDDGEIIFRFAIVIINIRECFLTENDRKRRDERLLWRAKRN